MKRTNEPILPRAIRNNNPCNIVRTQDPWKGMAAAQTDSRFVVFESMPYGFRAFFILMLTYYRTHQLHTIKDILSRYAPSCENNTLEYISSVSRRLSTSPTAPVPDLSEQSASFWCDFAMAVFAVESGAPLRVCGNYLAACHDGWVMFAQSVGISTRNFSPHIIHP